MTCKERFLKYIAVSTASDEDSTESPSTTRQLELSRRLAEEMLSLGLKNVHMDSCGNAIGTLPATEGVKAAGTLALVAHVDTAPAASGEGVNAREVLYTGEDIELGHGVILSEKQFPAMKDVRGQVLLVTDGSTLLGADDKAGVAEIMTAVEKLIASGAPHGELRIVFTTDEEVGRGTEGLDVKELACDWGYTVDGGELGVYEYENFNAAAALVRVHGVGIHPGSAKNIMKNADKPSLKYMDSVLRRWKKEGLTTPAQVQEQQQSFTAAKAKKADGRLQGKPSYDLEQIKRDTMNNTDIKF